LIDALDAKGILAARFRAHDMERVYHAIAHGVVAVQRVETHFIAGRGDGIRAMIRIGSADAVDAPPSRAASRDG
jgi:hypothetical protein